jgi:PAS domain S-box-containing protein
MPERLKHWLWLDKTPEDSAGRLSRLVFHLTLCLLGLFLALILAFAIWIPKTANRLFFAWPLLLFFIVSLPLLRRKWLKLGGGLLAGALWFANIYAILPAGVSSYAFFCFFFSILLFGFVFGLRAMGASFVLTILVEWSLAVLQFSGRWTPSYTNVNNPLEIALIQNFVLSIGVFLSAVAMHYYRQEHRMAIRELEERLHIQKDLEKSQLELQQREKLLKGVTNHLPGLVYQFSVVQEDVFQMHYVSRQSEQMLGLLPDTPDYFQQFLDHLVPEDQEPFLASLQAAISGFKPWNFEGHYIKPDGEAIIFQVLATLFRENGITFNGILLDVTETRRLEKIYSEKREELQAILENPMIGILVANENGRVEEWNTVFEYFTGLDKEKIQGQYIWDLTYTVSSPQQPAEAVKSRIKDRFRNSLSSGKLQFPATGTYTITHPDGKKITIQQNMFLFKTQHGQHLGAMILDITELEKARRALADSEALYRAIFEQSPSEISLTGQYGEIIDVNQKYCQSMGLSRNEIIGKTPLSLGRFTPQQFEIVRTIANQNQGIVNQLELVSKIHGKERAVLYSGCLIHLQDKPIMLTVINDITARKEAEQKVLHQLEEINGLREIDSSIILGAELADTLGIILKRAAESLHVDMVCLGLLSPDGSTFKDIFHLGDQFCQNKPMQEEHSLALQAIEQHQTVFLSASDPQAAFLHKQAYQSCCATPMLLKNEVKGVMLVFSRNTLNQNDRDWIDYLETLAGQAVIALSNSELIDNLRKKNDELLEAYESTIAGWARALEIRDEETFGHSERVLDMAMKVAQAMAMPENELANFRRGVLLHDIGKIGVPDSILLKPGPLDDHEWDVMRKHPVYAFWLLKGISFLKGALDVPYSHHERWDGSGYPQGLKGQEIPLSARIFAVVDVWDALTNDRPYRKAWSAQKTREYLLTNAGTQFDPQVVEVFLNIFGG